MNSNPSGQIETKETIIAVRSLQPFQSHDEVSFQVCLAVECLAEEHLKQLNNISLGSFLEWHFQQSK